MRTLLFLLIYTFDDVAELIWKLKNISENIWSTKL